jgi:hypothetical protein
MGTAVPKEDTAAERITRGDLSRVMRSAAALGAAGEGQDPGNRARSSRSRGGP